MRQAPTSDHDLERELDSDASDVLQEADSLNELTAFDSRDETNHAERGLSDDDVFEVLYSRRRRDAIAYLLEQGGTTTVGELAEHIAAMENETTVQQLSSYERKRVYVGLYQNHLPKMDQIGVVDYDKNRGTIRLRDQAKQLEPFLEDTGGSKSQKWNLAGAFVLGGLVLLGILDVGVFAVVPDQLWVTLGGVGVLGLVALDLYRGSRR